MRRAVFDIFLPVTSALLIHAGLVGALIWSSNYSPAPASGLVVVPVALRDVTEIKPELKEFDVGKEEGTGEALTDAPLNKVNYATVADAEQALTRVEPKSPRSQQTDAGTHAPPLPKVTTPGPLRPPPTRPDAIPLARAPIPPADVAVIDGATDPTPQPTSPQEPSDTASAKPSKPGNEPSEPIAATSDESLDPAMFANNDSDAFSTKEALLMTYGGSVIQPGRTIDKMRRPRFDLAFETDFIRLGGRVQIVYRIEIDTDGRPKDVTVIQSSGSRTIDEAVRRVLLETTYGGKRPDTFKFSFGIIGR
ncbi:MAG: energy transducer TonB [Tepidisphaeraceae bacterium]